MTEHTAEEVMALPFSRMTRRVRKALQLAQEEARRYAHAYLGTEHLLLGLLDEGEGVATAALRELGVEADRVRAAVEVLVRAGDRADLEGDVGMTPRATRAMALAVEWARRLSHAYVGTEHVLLGLIEEGEGIAAGVLESLGVTLEDARAAVLRLLGSHATGGVAVKGNVITCRIDDHDLDAIDALVEAGVRSTRSGAASWLIHAGIDANRELLEKVYGMVGEIRRLREEASSLAERMGDSAG